MKKAHRGNGPKHYAHYCKGTKQGGVCEVVSEGRMNNWLGMFVTDLGDNRV